MNLFALKWWHRKVLEKQILLQKKRGLVKYGEFGPVRTVCACSLCVLRGLSVKKIGHVP